MTNPNPTPWETETLLDAFLAAPDALAALEELGDDLARQIAIMTPYEKLVPCLPVGHFPALLLLIGKDAEAAELAVRLARTSLWEDGQDATEETILARVRAHYLTPAMIAAVAARRVEVCSK